MDKRLYLSLLLPLALAGCGGGDDGGGSKPTPKYTIDFASFYVTETEKDSTRCDIYDEKIYYELSHYLRKCNQAGRHQVS